MSFTNSTSTCILVLSSTYSDDNKTKCDLFYNKDLKKSIISFAQ